MLSWLVGELRVIRQTALWYEIARLALVGHTDLKFRGESHIFPKHRIDDRSNLSRVLGCFLWQVEAERAYLTSHIDVQLLETYGCEKFIRVGGD